MTISVKNDDVVQLNLLGERNPIQTLKDKKIDRDECLVTECSKDQECDWHNLCGSHEVNPRYAEPSHPVCPECGFDAKESDYDTWAGDICPECETDMVVKDRYCMICGDPISAFGGGHASDSLLIGSSCYVALLQGEKPEYMTEEMKRRLV